MGAHQFVKRHRRAERLALSGLSLVLAVVFSTLAFGCFFEPRVAEALAGDGYGAGFRFLLGSSHLVGALALMAPCLADKAAFVLGLLVAGGAAYLLAEGEGVMAGVPPLLLASALFCFVACWRLRHRADMSVWIKMLDRYADEDSRRRGRPEGTDPSGTAGVGSPDPRPP
jgi:hypothetical protein